MKILITIPQIQTHIKKLNYETIPATCIATIRTLFVSLDVILKCFHLKAICLEAPSF